MRLRERSSLRAPRRFDDNTQHDQQQQQQEESRDGTPFSTTQQGSPPPSLQNEPPPRRVIMPASARPAFPPPYVDYCPNMPPAAFPTLENPVPPGDGGYGRVHNVREQNEEGLRARPMQGVIGATGQTVETQEGGDSDWEDEEEEGDDEAHGSHNEESHEEPAFSVPKHVVWANITPRLQAEIMSNMSEVYARWPYIMSLLGLTLTERREATENLALRNKQIEQEDKQLKEMQEKQRRALLRIDNSVLRRMHVPPQLVFRNASKRYIRRSESRADPDFFMSKISEVLMARQFLRIRGLDVEFAGKWTNGFAAIEVDKYDDGEEKLEWVFDETLGAEGRGVEQDTVAQLEVNKNSDRVSPEEQVDNNCPLMKRKVNFINRFGDSWQQPTPRSAQPAHANAAQEILHSRRNRKTRRHRERTGAVTSTSQADGDGVVRLQIGPEGAATVQGSSSALVSSPPESTYAPPVPTPLRTSSAAAEEPTDSSGAAAGRRDAVMSSPTLPTKPSNVRREHKLPAKRALAGPWWYRSGETQGESSTPPSANLKDKLLAVRAETELERITRRSRRDAAASNRTFHGDLPFRPIQSSPPLNSRGNAVQIASSQTRPDASLAEHDALLQRKEQGQPNADVVAVTAGPCSTEQAMPAARLEPTAPGSSYVPPVPVADGFAQEMERTPDNGAGSGYVPANIEAEETPNKGKQTDNEENDTHADTMTDEPLTKPEEPDLEATETQEAPKTSHVEDTKTPEPAQPRSVPKTKGSTRSRGKGRGRGGRRRGSTVGVTRKPKSLPMQVPAKRAADSEEKAVSPQDETVTKKRKSTKKEEPTTGTRRSERLHGPGGRQLRPRTAPGESNK